MNCRHCGQKIEDFARFCPYCGSVQHEVARFNVGCENSRYRANSGQALRRWQWLALVGATVFCVTVVAVFLHLLGKSHTKDSQLKPLETSEQTAQENTEKTYTLQGKNYMSKELAEISGTLVHADCSPPFDDYSVLYEDLDYINYRQSGDSGYQYIVNYTWGLQLDTPILVEYNGQVTIVTEIGLCFRGDQLPPLNENEKYSCRGTIQDDYQMKLDSFIDNGDENLVTEYKHIDRGEYWKDDMHYSSLHFYFPFGNYMINVDEWTEDRNCLRLPSMRQILNT